MGRRGKFEAFADESLRGLSALELARTLSLLDEELRVRAKERSGRRVVGRRRTEADLERAELAVLAITSGAEPTRCDFESLLRTLATLGPGTLTGVVRARKLAVDLPGPLKGEKARKVARQVVPLMSAGRKPLRAEEQARAYLSTRVQAGSPGEALTKLARGTNSERRSVRDRLRRARVELGRSLRVDVIEDRIGRKRVLTAPDADLPEYRIFAVLHAALVELE